MNKISYAVLGVATLMLAACSQEEFAGLDTAKKGITLRATIEQSETRSSVADHKTFQWEKGDAITVFSADGKDKFSLIGEGPVASGEFANEDENFIPASYAVYPHNEAHYISGNTIMVTLPSEYGDNDSEYVPNLNSIMAAEIGDDTNTLSFKHLGGLFEFNMENVPAGVDKFTFTTNRMITGEFKSDFVDGITSGDLVVTNNNSVSIVFKALESEKAVMQFYVPVPTAKFNEFSIALYAGETKVFEKNYADMDIQMKRADLFYSSEVAFEPSADYIKSVLVNGGEVSVVGDIELDLTDNLTVPSDKQVSLNFINDATLTFKNGFLTVNGTLHLKGQGTIIGEDTQSGNYNKIIYVEGNESSGAALTLNDDVTLKYPKSDIDFTTSKAYYAVFMDNHANMEMHGGTINMNICNDNGRGISVRRNSGLDMEGGSIIATAFAVETYGNNEGANQKQTVNISGGVLESKQDYAIYIPGKPSDDNATTTLTVSGSPEIKGVGGIMSRYSGTVNISGTPSITAFGGVKIGGTPLGTGSTTAPNYALYLAGSKGTASIAGGSFIATDADQHEASCIQVNDGTSLSINKGNFNDFTCMPYLQDNALVNIELTKDLEFNEWAPVVLKADAEVIVEGNDHTVVNNFIGSQHSMMFYAVKGHLTINSGTYKVIRNEPSESKGCMAVWVNSKDADNYGTVTINGGTFFNSQTLNGNNDNQIDLIYSTGYGKVKVNGGDFSSANYSNRNNQIVYWLLNINNVDINTGSIEVTGGKFHKFNPAKPCTDDKETYVLDGYKVVVGDVENNDAHNNTNEVVYEVIAQ